MALLASFPIVGGDKEIDVALEKYYSGSPLEAISLLEPLASSGDLEAQYLLGNILYSLSQTGNYEDIDDPVKWYKMASEQDSPEADYAIAAIYHNKWLESRNEEEAATAITYYLRAVERGYEKAKVPLDKLMYRSRISEKEAAALALKLDTAALVKPEPEPAVPIAETESVESSVSKPVEVEPVVVSEPEPVQKQEPELQSEQPKPELEKEPIVVAESVSANPDVNDQIADIYDSDVTTTVSLTELARHCSNFTATGFNLYVSSIRGAGYSGAASVAAVKPDSELQGFYAVNLTHSESGVVVLVDLRKVPKKVAQGLTKGGKSALPGVIVSSKVMDTDCILSAEYRDDTG